MDLKSLLNKEQYEGAVTIDGPVLILAGAGSGKTRVLTYRMAHMIENMGVRPYKILAITFTNKAAREMKERVEAIIGERANDMWISTFHSTCVRILRREIEKLGYKKNFTIYDTSDQKTLITECMKSLQINDKDIDYREIVGKIGRAKDNLQSAESYMREHESNFREKKIADVYLMYQKRLKENNAMDFDDLIFKTVELFKKDSDTLEFYQRKFEYIMVDEYQDTNGAQYELVRLLASKHRNICVVGDDDQCLVEGTLIQGEKSKINIENLNQGELIRVASGNGESALLPVTEIFKKKYEGEVIKVITKSGNIVTSTPNHLTFCKVIAEKGKYYVYLMYKEGLGYIIGESQSSINIQGRNVSYLKVMLTEGVADKIWTIEVCESKSEAENYQEYYSSKYKIPRVTFDSVHVNILKEKIMALSNGNNTIQSAEKLMDEQNLYIRYPHNMSLDIIKDNKELVYLTMFGGAKSNKTNMYSHTIALDSSCGNIEDKLAQIGFTIQNTQKDIDLYDEAEEYLSRLSCSNGEFEVVRRAKFTEESSAIFMPIGSLKKGMMLCTLDGKNIIEDQVVSVEREHYSGYVYDLNIDNARNYIANNVVVHNCIYQWRGADIKNILGFEKDYPEAKVIKLEQNYRSKGNILTAANEVIVNNANRKSKVLRTEQEAGGKIKIYRAYADSDEGNFVSKKINEHKRDGYKNRDFAILYRTNAQSRIFEESLRRNDIPYKIVGGTRFYDRKEIKDILSYLKVLVNPLDDIALRRIINVPKRGIGDATINKVMDFAAEYEMPLYDALLQVRTISTLTARNCAGIENFMELLDKFMDLETTLEVSHLIEAILEETGYIKELEKSKEIEDKSRIENLKELVSDAVDFEKTSEDKTLEAYLEKVSLVQDTDKLEDENEDSGSVVLMTVHSAKGLEFPIVFMVGMENGIFPGMSSFEKDSEMEESRRLCYVGITRAKEQLYMTSAEVRRVFGRTVSYAQSDFINEIKSDLKEYVSGDNGAVQSRRAVFGGGSSYNNPHSLRGNNSYKRTTMQLSQKNNNTNITQEISLGRKVKHDKFGVGTVVGVNDAGNDKKLTIAFDNQGIKILMQSLANLEVL